MNTKQAILKNPNRTWRLSEKNLFERDLDYGEKQIEVTISKYFTVLNSIGNIIEEQWLQNLMTSSSGILPIVRYSFYT